MYLNMVSEIWLPV